MPTLIVPEVIAVAGRTEDFTWSAYAADGATPVAFAASDKVRFKLARKAGDTPLLDLVSGSVTANGSTVSITDLGDVNADEPATGGVRLAQADTDDFDGEYHFELNLVDDSETNPADAIKQICRGKIKFLKSQGGSLGL